MIKRENRNPQRRIYIFKSEHWDLVHKTLSQPLRYTTFDVRERLVSVPFRFRSCCTGYSAFMSARKAIRYSPGGGLSYITVADPGEGIREPGPPLFSDQNEARRTPQKFFLETAPPLSQGLDDRPPPPPLI